MFQQIFAVVAPVFLIAAIGYAWDKRRLPFDTAMVTYLASNIGAPCLLLGTILQRRPQISEMLEMVAAATILVVITGLLGAALLRVLRQPARVYLPGIMFPNAGNMGIPLAMFAFGEAGLAAAVAFFATMSVLQFSLGIAVSSGRLHWREVVGSPVIWAMIIAFAMIGLDLRLPTWIDNTVQVLAGMVIPLMMLSLGISLARLKPSKGTLGRSLGFAVFRLGAGFVVAVGIVHVLGLTGPARGVALIQSSMPTAVFNYLFALRYDNRPDEVAGMVVVSTLIAFALLPFLMIYVLQP